MNETSSRLNALLARLLGKQVRLTLGIIGLAGLGFVASSFTNILTDHLPALAVYVIREIGTALLVTALITFLIKIFIDKDYEEYRSTLESYLREEVSSHLHQLHDDVAQQTDRLLDASTSLEAMHSSGLDRVFETRTSAAEAIRRDLLEPGVNKILSPRVRVAPRGGGKSVSRWLGGI